MRNSLLAAIAAMPLLVLMGSVYADPIEDPFLDETQNTTNTCPANCASVVLATDPLSGKTTVEYVLQTSTGSAIIVTPGDVKVTEFGSSTVGDLLRFEDIPVSPTSPNRGVLFLFSSDTGGGFDADVGLPATFQALTASLSENSSGQTSTYSPTTSAQPGNCVILGTTTSCSIGYVLNSPDDGIRVPEPLTISFFGASLAGLAVLRRRKKVAAQQPSVQA
jgi:hypothetical protein